MNATTTVPSVSETEHVGSQRPAIVFDERSHKYTVNGQQVPSVTQILGVLDKPALPPWAAKVTLEGVCNLIKLHKVTRGKFVLPDEPKRMRAALKKRKLDHFSAVSDSQVRGTAVHKALEEWINNRRVPLLKDFELAHRGYIQGLTRFLVECNPEFLESEKIVGSARYEYAGKLDTVCFVKDDKHGRAMLDLKTSKQVWFATQFPQLRGYEIANVECEGEPTDAQGIVRVGDDGSYEVEWSCATDEDFLSILRAWRSQHELEERVKEARRESR